MIELTYRLMSDGANGQLDFSSLVPAPPEDLMAASKVSDCLRGSFTRIRERVAQEEAEDPEVNPIFADVFRSAAKMSDCLRKAFADQEVPSGDVQRKSAKRNKKRKPEPRE